MRFLGFLEKKRQKMITPNVVSLLNDRIANQTLDSLKTVRFESVDEVTKLFAGADFKKRRECFEQTAQEFAKRDLVIDKIDLLRVQQLRQNYQELDDRDFWALWSSVFGFGPLEGFLTLSGISEISIFGNGKCFLEIKGLSVEVDLRAITGWDTRELLNQFMKKTSAEINDSKLWCDAVLTTEMGEKVRAHVVLPPLAQGGPSFSFRKLGDLQSKNFKWHPSEQAAEPILKQILKRKKNVLIVGATGSGKTTLLSQMLDWIDFTERIVTIEDTLEIRSSHPHIVSLLSRESNPMGLGAVTLRQLIRQTLRMKADRIVLGECRGEEAFDVLQALSTGHEGSLATIHGSSCRGALVRLALLCQLSGAKADRKAWEEWVAASIDYVVLMTKKPNSPRVTEICEVGAWDGQNGFFIKPIWQVTGQSLESLA